MAKDIELREQVKNLGSKEKLEIGQWYWVDDDWFGCVVHIGSNHVELKGPASGRSTYTAKIHFDEIHARLSYESNYQAVLQEKVSYHQSRVNDLMQQVKDLTARLGVSPRMGIEDTTHDSTTTDLVALSSTQDLDTYKSDLEKAKEETLPSLFKEIRDHNESAASWMSAETLPLEATMNKMGESLKQIDNRIFNVSLYAGLTEEVVQVREGEPAPYDEKLRLMQRMLFMDEECLLRYKLGGMEFQDISEFDRWMSEEENYHRILPFPRCMVAMRVRRHKKYRHFDGSLNSAMISIRLGELDKATFFYIRNGDQLYRMNSDLDLDEMIFPNRDQLDFSEPMMAKIFCGRVDKMMPVREYEDILAKLEEKVNLGKEWKEANPDKHKFDNPYRHDMRDFSMFKSEWVLFDPSSVYYDDCVKKVEEQVRYYNRIALIIQGLFDRSPVLHPHPPAKTWTEEGFRAAIELVYDADHTLYGQATPPDFEAYRERLNASLEEGSITAGQQDYWERLEGEKVTRKSMEMGSNYWPDRHQPFGNPGPGELAKVAKWKPRAKKATYRWERERQTFDPYGEKDDYVPARVEVPASEILNVSAYTPGDYRQFFEDPRTRESYLQWAPFMLLAEEYHAGNISLEDS